MTFQQLQYLLEIHRTGSASKAAKNLFVSQPSVSSSLNTLESELGFPIFIRNQQGLQPTKEGELVIEYAKRICATHSLLTNIHKGDCYTFALASNSRPQICRAYARLIEENRGRDDITFSACSGGVRQIIDMLLACKINVGVIYTLSSWASYNQKKFDECGLEWHIIRSEPIGIRIGPKHPLYNIPDLKPNHFKNDYLIESYSKEISSSVFRGILPIDQKRVITASGGEMNLELVVRGLGYSVGVIPSPDTPNRHNLRYIPLTGYTYEVFVVTNPLQAPTAESTRFIALLHEEFEKS